MLSELSVFAGRDPPNHQVAPARTLKPTNQHQHQCGSLAVLEATGCSPHDDPGDWVSLRAFARATNVTNWKEAHTQHFRSNPTQSLVRQEMRA